MTKTKRIVSLILCIALSISCLTVIAFACTVYRTGVIKKNIETAYYTNTGSYIRSEFSWDGTNYHPSFIHSESLHGVRHQGILYKYTYTHEGIPTSGLVRRTTWVGYYQGLISG